MIKQFPLVRCTFLSLSWSCLACNGPAVIEKIIFMSTEVPRPPTASVFIMASGAVLPLTVILKVSILLDAGG